MATDNELTREGFVINYIAMGDAETGE